MSKLELVSLNEPKSQISEIFRTLRTNIQFMNVKNDTKSLLITSSFPGEGKSWVSSNLAVTFAQLGKRVILVDADLRRGRLHTIFNLKSTPGLSDYLSNSNRIDLYDIIKPTEKDDLFVIPRGTLPPNPSELLNSDKIKNLISDLETRYDLVIIDGTPCELVNDARILSTIADSTIVVTQYNKTKKADLKKTIDGIRNVGGNINGIVLNNVQTTEHGSYYSNNYYYSDETENNKGKNKAKKKYKKHNMPKVNIFKDIQITPIFENKDVKEIVEKQKAQEEKISELERIEKEEQLKQEKIEKERKLELAKKQKQEKIENARRAREEAKKERLEKIQQAKKAKIEEIENQNYLRRRAKIEVEKKKQIELEVKFEIKQKEIAKKVEERKQAEERLKAEKEERINRENELKAQRQQSIEYEKVMKIKRRDELKEAKKLARENAEKSLDELIKTKYSNFYATPIEKENNSIILNNTISKNNSINTRNNLKVYVDIKDKDNIIWAGDYFEEQYNRSKESQL